MSIAPVTAAVEIRQPPEQAFELFTTRIADWWYGKGFGPNPAVSVTIEPFAGGRWYETDAEGTDTLHGTILAWEPPTRVLLAWQLDGHFEPSDTLQTEVEITFTPTASGGTRVALEHRNLERFGADLERVTPMLQMGWTRQLESVAELGADAIP